MGLGNATTISVDTKVPAGGYNVLLYTSNLNSSITVSSGVNYTVGLGSDVLIKNMNNI
jgi:hypothetical protein